MTKAATTWKGTRFDAEHFTRFDNQAGCFVCLTEMQVQILLSALAPANWRTRWENTDPQGIDWIGLVQEIERKLLSCEEVFEDGGAGYVYSSDCVLYQGERMIVDLRDCRESANDPPVTDGEKDDSVPGDDTYLCNAVEALRVYIQDRGQDIIGILESFTDVLEASEALITQFFSVIGTYIAPEVVSFVSELLEFGVSLIDIFWNDNGWEDTMRCEIYNVLRCGRDGSFDGQLVKDLYGSLPALPWTTDEKLGRIVAYMAVASLSKRNMYYRFMSGIDDVSALCAACEDCPPEPWDHIWWFDDEDFIDPQPAGTTYGQGDWVAWEYNTFPVGEYVGFAGWHVVNWEISASDKRRVIYIRLPMNISTTITKIEVGFDIVKGEYSSSTANVLRFYADDTETHVKAWNAAQIFTGDDQVKDFDLENFTDVVKVRLTASTPFDSAYGGGDAYVKWIRLYGEGDKPTFTL